MLDEEARRAREHEAYLREVSKRSEEPKKTRIETPVKEKTVIAPKRINMAKYEDLMS